MSPNVSVSLVRFAAGGRVRQLEADLSSPGFFGSCERRYTAAGFGEPSGAERRSWRASWPPILRMLMRAGLGDFHLYLEFGIPGGAQRLDGLLLGGQASGALTAIVLELKQWADAQYLSEDRTLVRRADGEEAVHPVLQVASYLQFLRDWFPAGALTLDTRGVLFMHNASPSEVETLSADHDYRGEISVLGADAAEADSGTLRAQLRAQDLTAPTPRQVEAFDSVRWAPSRRLMSQVARTLDRTPSYALVGDQQKSLHRIRETISQASRGHGGNRVITVVGPPGSGKTALAVRLLAMKLRQEGTEPRYCTPSGTLQVTLREAVGKGAAANLFVSPGTAHSHVASGTKVLILDEAQRLKRQADGFSADLRNLIRRTPVLVVFLDERQIIRPDEGVTVQAIAREAAAAGSRHEPLELTGSFRNAGSGAFTRWVDDLLYGRPRPWTDAGYDLDTVPGPFHLQQWIDSSSANGLLARTSAGFCWPWARSRSLNSEVKVEGWDPSTRRTHMWSQPWNADRAVHDADGRLLAPKRQLWASQTGGHRQVGCIYTAQGLEYDHAGVILGPDLIYRDGHWQAQPGESHDDDLKQLAAAQYLPLALNIYRVLLTRGTRACRVYSVDEPTQKFLTSLMKTPQP